MSERLPKNLEIAYEAFGREAIDDILDGVEFEVDGIEFLTRYIPDSRPERFCIAKPTDLIEMYEAYLPEWQPRRIFELGIAEGGSAVYMVLRAKPDKLVTIDLETERLEALDEFIASRSLGDVLKPYYGVDQTDRTALTKIVEDEFGDELLDLVIDDASHVYAPTVCSFEILFPRVRPGGWYLIEDWSANLKMKRDVANQLAADDEQAEEVRARIAEAMRSRDEPPEQRDPLTRFGLELVLSAGAADDAIADLRVNRHVVCVQRGEGDLNVDDFSLASIAIDHEKLLQPPLTTP